MLKQLKGQRLLVGGCWVAALLISLLPMSLLRLSDKAVLNRPRPRARAEALVPYPENEVYLAQALAKREQPTVEGGDLTRYYATGNDMGAAEGASLLGRYLRDLQAADVLSRDRAERILARFAEDGTVGYRYRTADGGFLTFFASGNNVDFCSVTVESRTGLVTALWLEEPAGQPAPDKDAALSAYAAYLGLGALDWQRADETDYADTSAYCAGAGLLLSVQQLPVRHRAYYGGAADLQDQQYFLAARALPPEDFEAQRRQWRALHGRNEA